jgi:antirestriction protein ArdC
MNREDALKQSEQALEKLAEALAQGKSESLVRYLDLLARFHHYSLGNCLLIAIQRPDATRVAGFHRWKQLGRYVKKGEKGIVILAPIVRRRKAEDRDESSDNEEPQNVRGFRTVHVFDVFQTDGADLAEFSRVTGDPGEKLEQLAVVVAERGIELRYEPNLGGADGLSKGGVIVLREGMAPAEQFAVLAHELAHELLHRNERRKETTRKVRELEAEAVAFVVSRAAGLDGLGHATDYIQLYAGDKELLLESLDHIQRVSSEIIGELAQARQTAEAAVA